MTHDAGANDMVAVARYFIPTEAHIVRSCLVAAGIPAMVADDNLVQLHSLLTPALGGVRVLVPVDREREAIAVIDAFHRGVYRLDDDFDVGAG